MWCIGYVTFYLLWLWHMTWYVCSVCAIRSVRYVMYEVYVVVVLYGVCMWYVINAVCMGLWYMIWYVWRGIWGVWRVMYAVCGCGV